MTPIVTVVFNGSVSARGRFLNSDGTMNMERLRAVLPLPESIDLGTLNFLVPNNISVTVSTDTWIITVSRDG